LTLAQRVAEVSDVKFGPVYSFVLHQKRANVRKLSKVLKKTVRQSQASQTAVDSRNMPTHERAYDASPQ